MAVQCIPNCVSPKVLRCVAKYVEKGLKQSTFLKVQEHMEQYEIMKNECHKKICQSKSDRRRSQRIILQRPKIFSLLFSIFQREMKNFWSKNSSKLKKFFLERGARAPHGPRGVEYVPKSDHNDLKMRGVVQQCQWQNQT